MTSRSWGDFACGITRPYPRPAQRDAGASSACPDRIVVTATSPAGYRGPVTSAARWHRRPAGARDAVHRFCRDRIRILQNTHRFVENITMKFRLKALGLHV